jgi:hypothetical protein
MARGARQVRARLKTRRTRELEAALAHERDERVRLCAENARLRDENRALLNSILGIAGIPPVSVATHDASVLGTTSSAEDLRTNPSPQSGPGAPASGPVSPSTDTNAQAAAHPQRRTQANAATAREKNMAQVAPMRRRSWQQINRTLEFEAARKKAGRDTDAVDAR